MESEDDIQPLISNDVDIQSQERSRGSFLGLKTQLLNTDPDLEQVIF